MPLINKKAKHFMCFSYFIDIYKIIYLKLIDHELIIIHHCSNPYNRLGNWIFLYGCWQLNTCITGDSDHSFSAWPDQEADGNLSSVITLNKKGRIEQPFSI
ncbi:MAG: hypothetical protein JWP45_1970 [Mucilaginibacter sp.]|nr:hypothetical protein [Mucilaginibacter sp.]